MTETTFPPEAGEPLTGDGRVVGPIEEGVPCWVDPMSVDNIACTWLGDGTFAIIVEPHEGEAIAFALPGSVAAKFFRIATAELAKRDTVVPRLARLLECTKAERGA